jgi:signal transduction histidine kinase
VTVADTATSIAAPPPLRLPRWRNLRLQTKLTLLIEALVLLLGGATGLLATARARATLEAELSKRGLAIAGDLAMFAVRPLLANDLAALRRFVNHTMSHDYVRYVAVVDPGGTVVMHSDLPRLGSRLEDRATRAALASDTPGSVAAAAATGEPLYAIHFPVTAAGARLGTVLMGYSRAAAEAEIGRVRRQILLVWLVTAALGGVAAFALSAYIARPLARIAAAMPRAAAGATPLALDASRGDELGVLASSFNRMAEDLARHRQHLNELVETRTAALRQANVRLENEIAERARVEEDLRQSRQELRDLAAHLQSVREEERTEVAREIHDELGQALTALKMDAHWAGQRLDGAPDPVRARLAEMSRLIDATVHAVRRLSSRLRPKLLDDLGLSAAIEWQAHEFERHAGIACRITSEPDDLVLDQTRSTALFRIFQETLTNVARHAGASRVDVALRHFGDAVEMTVADDGGGIELARVSDRRSLGLVGMRERVRALGGRLDISGAAGRGTTVRVSLPVDREGGA